MADRLTVKTPEAAALAEEIFLRLGVPHDDAALVSGCFLRAETGGMPSHGFMRLRPTAERLKTGLVNPRPDIRRELLADNILRYDADGAMGQVAGHRAMGDCVRIAKERGSAFAAIRRAFHFGMLSEYTLIAAEKGCLAFVCTNSSAQMAPWGGIDRALGTNPFAVAFPEEGEDCFSLDISTAAAARGKIRLAAREGRSIPEGWAIDPEGRDTTDPEAALRGTVLPMAGHKGFGMAMAVDMLSGILTGADLSYEASNMFEGREKVNTGCFMAVLDISRFVSPEEYETRAAGWLSRLRASAPRPGSGGVRVPGDTRNALRREEPKTVTLSRDTWEDMHRLLEELNGGNAT